MKIRSTKQFKDGINAAFDTQESRAAAKRQCDDLARDFDERHETLCKYAAEHPEVFDVGTGGKSHEGATDRVKYKMTPGETLERIEMRPGTLPAKDVVKELEVISRSSERTAWTAPTRDSFFWVPKPTTTTSSRTFSWRIIVTSEKRNSSATDSSFVS